MKTNQEIAAFTAALEAVSTPERAAGEKRYLKSDLDHLGAPVPAIRQIARVWVRAHRDLDREDLVRLARALFRRRVHELRALSTHLLMQREPLLEAVDADLLEDLLRRSKTWVHVDNLSVHVVGPMFERLPRTDSRRSANRTFVSLSRPAMRFTGLLLPAVLSLALAACARPPAPTPVILVTIDTLRADRLGCYGYFRDTSPNLDRLSADAVLFTHALTPMSTTLPAHVSLMTALYPTQHGVRGNFEHLGRTLDTGNGVATLAQSLQAAGWRTAAFVAATPLKRNSGIGAGFDVFDEPERESRRAGAVVERALSWLDAADGSDGADAAVSEPFFLWLHLWDPHHPYAPPPEFERAFDGAEDVRQWMAERRFSGVDDPDVVRQNNDYDDEIRYVDTQIGVLVAALRERGLYDEVALVVTSDHGEGLGQHDWLRHGRIYEEELRVPLIMRFPPRLGLNGRRHDGIASLIDVVPTLAGRLGLLTTGLAGGGSRGIDLLAPGSERRRVLFAERVYRSRTPWEDGDKFALTDGEWKYFHLSEGADELFHLLRDPYELDNVIEDHPEIARRMRARLEEMMAELAHSAVDLAGEGLSEERRRELESLGYVE